MRNMKFSIIFMCVLALAAFLNGCGSSSKEGQPAGTGFATVAKVDETTCRVCHATSNDKVGRNIINFYNNSPHGGKGPNEISIGCQGCHGGGAQHNGVGPLPYMAKNADQSCKECHKIDADGPYIQINTNAGNTVPVGKSTAKTVAAATVTIRPTFGGSADVRAHHVNLYLKSVGAKSDDARCGACHSAHDNLGTFVDPAKYSLFVNDNGQPTAAALEATAAAQAAGVTPATASAGVDCLSCHSYSQDRTEFSPIPLVNDNSGVRAITTEFAKWSHHVTGVTLTSAHCAACHLEGKPVNGVITLDTAKHMVDNKVHLRNVDTDEDMQWDPAAPNHSSMDNFCMSCHDADGATSPMSAQIQALINTNGLVATGKTAAASNPFGDTISNRYDKMQRPAVVDASSQFNTTNNSHHAVKGPRYSGNSRFTGLDANGNPRRQVLSPATFAQNSSALLKGVRSTIFDAGNFNQLYTPLENAGGEAAPRTGSAPLGDDSTLHCGDCHTVGQWKVGSSVNKDGNQTTAAIGAHGSNNEYLLRNSKGTDERHTQNAFTISAAGVINYTNPNGAFLVCYNCHTYTKYGSIYLGTGLGIAGATQPHAGEYDAQGRCNGIGNTLPFNGYTTGTATDGTQFASRFSGPVATFGATPAFAPGFPLNGTAPTGEQNPDFGNIFGIQCANCHNSGIGNAYGGIHGSAKNQNTVTKTVDPSVTGGAYIDGMGNTTKIERFLPGLGNAMHVPGTLGGFTGGTTVQSTTATPYAYTTGGISNDTNWEQKHWQQTASTVINEAANTVTGTLTSAGAGCYTLGTNATNDVATGALRGPSVTGAGGPETELFDTWGGCDDHNAKQGNGDHGFVKRIVRPITY